MSKRAREGEDGRQNGVDAGPRHCLVSLESLLNKDMTVTAAAPTTNELSVVQLPQLDTPYALPRSHTP